MRKPLIEKLYAHLSWADDLTLESLRAAAELPAQALGLYAHVVAAELVWLGRLEGETASLPVWPRWSVAECAGHSARAQEGFVALLARTSEEDLGRNVHYANSAGQEFDTPIGEILVHVALHGSYHRGQIALLLREAGEQPAATDYIAYVRGVAAATRR
ncbi:MAG TPA: DinB family protein [Thermoanaerobaculia bacterium]|nr:DinB family protein [Thermoanaerobaculia bacterium]